MLVRRETVLCQNALQVAAWIESKKPSADTRFLDGREFWGDQGAERWASDAGFTVVTLNDLRSDELSRIIPSELSDPHQVALLAELRRKSRARRRGLFRRKASGLSKEEELSINLQWLAPEEPPGAGDRRYWDFVKDGRRGQTCVILGNGPSLNKVDFNLLRDIDTFGVNSIFLAKNRLTKPLTYYVVEDTKVMEENLEAIAQVKAEHRYFPGMYRDALSSVSGWTQRDEDAFFNLNLGFYGRGTPSLAFPRFSMDVGGRVFAGQTVTYINLQLAFWLGYRKVILVGMDFSYSIPESSVVSGNHILSQGPDPNHFHPDYFGEGKTWKDPKLDRVLLSYQHAKSVYELYGREIVNATDGGKLEVFRREGLSEALQT